MSGVFREEILADKLSELNNTQQCIQSILRYFAKLNSEKNYVSVVVIQLFGLCKSYISIYFIQLIYANYLELGVGKIIVLVLSVKIFCYISCSIKGVIMYFYRKRQCKKNITPLMYRLFSVLSLNSTVYCFLDRLFPINSSVTLVHLSPETCRNDCADMEQAIPQL